MRYLDKTIIKNALYFTTITIIPLLVLQIVVVVFSMSINIPPTHLSRDPASIASFHPLTGFLSNVGVLLWCSATAVCFFTSSVFKYYKEQRSHMFFFASALLSLILMIDDLFMIHDYIFPVHLHLSEELFYLFLGVLTLSYLIYFAWYILNTNYLLLFFALSFFSLSMGIDVILHGIKGFLFIEDAFKLYGIGCWLAYFVTLGHSILRNRFSAVEFPEGTDRARRAGLSG